MTAIMNAITKTVRRFSGFSGKKKAFLTLTTILLLALPLFAVANPQVMQSVTVQIQGLLSSSQATNDQPMSLEEGISHLSYSGAVVVEVAAGGNHSLAILDDGTLWSWGGGGSGQLGHGIATNEFAPRQIGTANTWASISAGNNHSLALQDNGTLWSWGAGGEGQIGHGNNANGLYPRQIGSATWNSISAGALHSLALRSDGTLWSWGWNLRSQLGRSGTTNQNSPGQVGNLNTWTSISAGELNSAGTRNNGTLWIWGYGTQGQLSNGSFAPQAQVNPVQVHPGSTGANPRSTTWSTAPGHISIGWHHIIALQNDGTLWSWGGGGGTANPADRSAMLGGRAGATNVAQQVGTANNWTNLSAGGHFSLATQSDGTLWIWGAGRAAARPNLGHGDVTLINSPQQMGNANNWDSISTSEHHVLATQDDGTLWTWGAGGNLRLAKGQGAGSDTVVHPDNFPWRVAASVAHPTGAWNVEANRNNATVPANAATNVPVGTSTLNVNFDRPMRTDIVGTLEISTDGGATFAPLVPTNLVWSGTGTGDRGVNTILTVSVPAETFDLVGTQYTIRIAGFVDAQFARTDTLNLMYPYQWSFTTGVPLAVTTVTPAGIGVPVDTENLVITFSEAVNPAVVGTASLRSQTLDLTNAVWSAGDTVLTIPLPIVDVATDRTLNYGTTYPVLISGFVSALGGAMSSPHNHQFSTEPLILDCNFSKILHLPEGTSIPDVSFAFRFTPVQVSLQATPSVNSVPASDVPAITPDPTISINPGTAVTNNGIITVVGILPNSLQEIIGGLNFPAGGVYVWEVHEVEGSSGVNTPPTSSVMTYDPARFQIRAHVDRDGNVAVIEIVELIPGEETGSFTTGEKLEYLTFVNTYRPIGDGVLEISKTIPVTSDTGQHANLTTLFDFTLSLEEHQLMPIAFPLEGVVLNRADAIVRTVNISGLNTSFQLADGERLLIVDLPAGTIFSVLEDAHPEFSPEVEVILGSGASHAASSGQGTSLSTGDHLLSDEGTSTAAFTNTHHPVHILGLLLDAMPFIAVAVFATVVAALLVTSRRLKETREVPNNQLENRM